MVRFTLLFWFLAGCGLVAVTQAGYLSVRNWDPTAFLQVGPGSPAKAILERELGPLYLAPTLGHDGKYFYLMARYPWFPLADAELREGLQDPAYRYGRPLYPMVAGMGGTLSPRATLTGLIAVQFLAGGLYFVAVVILARQNGLPITAALVGVFNPGLFSSAVLLTSDLLAMALVVWGLAAWQRGRTAAAIVFFAAATLAKEYYALTPLALVCSLAFQQRWRSASTLLVGSLLPLMAWKLAAWIVLGPGEGGGNFAWPGEGIRAAAREWTHALPLGILAILVVIFAMAAAVWRTPSLPRGQSAVWGLLALNTSYLVWADPADALRVLAPLWWFVIWAWWPTKSTFVFKPN